MRRRLIQRASSRAQRGMTLIEAVLAIAVLAIGFTGVLGLVGNVSTTNRASAFLNSSLDAFTALSSQIQNAACDMSPSSSPVDVGLSAGGWVSAAVPGSEITFVGLIDAARNGATAPVRVVYRPTRIAGNCPAPCTQPDSYQIDVQVCDQSDPAKMPCNPPQVGYWVRSFQLTKTCTLRPDDSGRGEYY